MTQTELEWMFGNKHKIDLIKEDLGEMYTEVAEAAQNALQSLCEDFEIPTPSPLSILAITCLWREPIPLVAAASSIAEFFSNDRPTGCAIAAEALIALDKTTGLVAVYQKGKRWMARSTVELDIDIDSLMYMPPMISKPNPLVHNTDSAYYSVEEPLILGDKRNYHDGDICLDVLNTQNQVKYHLNWEFLNRFEEPNPGIQHFDKHLAQAKLTRNLMGIKEFYVPNKVDSRGRVYTCGYHINPQGTPFHKAMLLLKEEHLQ